MGSRPKTARLAGCWRPVILPILEYGEQSGEANRRSNGSIFAGSTSQMLPKGKCPELAQ